MAIPWARTQFVRAAGAFDTQRQDQERLIQVAVVKLGSAAERLGHALTNDTALGVIRYADAGYPESFEEIGAKAVPYIALQGERSS